ncbi:MAG TPA: hypothetical protein VF485_01330 [Sphingomonas sp.]
MRSGFAATIIGGIATQAFAVLCWYAFHRLFAVDVLKLWVNLILPLGAFDLGIVGGWGFYAAGRRAKQPSTPNLVLFAVFIAVLTAIGIRFLGYWSAEYEGMPLHRSMDFVAYLRATLGHARIDFSHGGGESAVVHVGSLGYLMELFQMAAYAVASYGFAAKLPSAIWCERCQGHMHDSLSGKLRYDDPRVFEQRYRSLPAEPAARLIALRMMESESDARGIGAIDFRYRLAECPSCSAAAVAEAGRAYTGQYWAPRRVLTRVGRFDRGQAARPQLAPDPARPVGPPIRTFGRRTTI